jgi:thiol-disulfide isomerase/thioredoxin
VNSNGTLTPEVTLGKLTVCLLQGNFCGYCTQVKPMFQNFAKNNPQFQSVNIQIDGNDSEKRAFKKLSNLVEPGVPRFLAFSGDGKYLDFHKGERTEKDLLKFMNNFNK